MLICTFSVNSIGANAVTFYLNFGPRGVRGEWSVYVILATQEKCRYNFYCAMENVVI